MEQAAPTAVAPVPDVCGATGNQLDNHVGYWPCWGRAFPLLPPWLQRRGRGPPGRADMAKYNREWPLPIVADGRCRSSSCFWWDIQLWTTNGKLYAPPFDAYRRHEVLPVTGERLSVVAQALCWTNPS